MIGSQEYRLNIPAKGIDGNSLCIYQASNLPQDSSFFSDLKSFLRKVVVLFSILLCLPMGLGRGKLWQHHPGLAFPALGRGEGKRPQAEKRPQG